MCGIAGFVGAASDFAGSNSDAIAERMALSLSHRGPDDQGIWRDAEAGAALVHRRLSIIDLSPAGHQPMLSADGRFVMSYNGEVYSYQPIAAELAASGHKFRGHCDTEVILESFAVNGIEPTLKRMIGMFAIALWDRRERTLTLVRDRLGIKPLYWAKFGDLFLFGSELKALRAHPGWTPHIDRNAVAAFMRHNYIPAPHTIYEGVHKLEPGAVLTLPWQGEPQISRFWDARAVARNGMLRPLEGTDAELTEQLETLLQDAVGRRMIADVPLGAFLSGGIDSSTVVALMQAARSGRVRTFSIGFDIPGYNEAPQAAAVARHLQTEHTELTVTADEARDVIPQLPEWYDEPFADSSQIPTYLVSAMTRKHVTVALSGDGGDELFAGYNRYQLTQRAWRALSLLPRPLRKAAAAVLTAMSPDRWTSLLAALPSRMRPPQAGDKVHKAASVLRLDSADAIYRRLVSHWEPAEVMPQAREPQGLLDDPTLAKEFPDLLARMQFLGSGHLPARRHFDQSGPRQHGGGIGSAGAAARSSGRGILLAAAARRQSPRQHQQVAVAAGALSPRATGTRRAAEDGIRHSARRMAARAAARLGRGAASRTTAAGGGLARCRHGSPLLAGTSRRPAQLAISPVGRADAGGLARTLGLKLTLHGALIADGAPERYAVGKLHVGEAALREHVLDLAAV